MSQFIDAVAFLELLGIDQFRRHYSASSSYFVGGRLVLAGPDHGNTNLAAAGPL